MTSDNRKKKRHDPHFSSEPQFHRHGIVDPSILATDKGLRATKWSFFALLLTALVQVIIVLLSGSVALLADTLHNFADALTAIPLWVAFGLVKWKPSRRFTYGYGRVEDLAGLIIVVTVFISALFSGYQSFSRLFDPQGIKYLWTVAAASLIGFFGNESVARYRIKVGNEIGSAALVADGKHARVDALTSLSVLIGALGVWLGYPLADPIVGIFITVAILGIVWESGKTVFSRLLDGVEPRLIDEIKESVSHTAGVLDVSEVRLRWIGHTLHAEVNVAVDAGLSVREGHEISKKVRHELLHQLKYLSNAIIHIDPVSESGEEHHRVERHRHGDLSWHCH